MNANNWTWSIVEIYTVLQSSALFQEISMTETGDTMTANDITLMVASDAEDWGKYVSGKLKKFGMVSHSMLVMDKEPAEYANPPEVVFACQNSMVVLLLVTPQLVDFLRDHASWFPKVLQDMPPTSSVIVLSLLDEENSEDFDHATADHYVMDDWVFFDPGYDDQEVKKTLAKVLDIVEKCRTAKCEAEKAQKAEKEKSRTGTKSRRKKTKPPASPAQLSSGSEVEFFPSTIYEHGCKVALVFKQDIEGIVSLKFEQTDIQVTPHRENDKVYTFSAPHLLPGTYEVAVKVNEGTLCRTCLVVREVDMATFTSPHYLRQILRLDSLHKLDLHLKNSFASSLPSGRDLRTVFQHLPMPHCEEKQKTCEGLYPTLLHYAGAHGLAEFSAALLECPGSSIAYAIPNCDGKNPSELATDNGFDELGSYISEFMVVQRANEIYDHYIAMHPAPEEEPSSEDYYEDMTEVFDTPQRQRGFSMPDASVNIKPAVPCRRISECGAGNPTHLQAASTLYRPPLPLPRVKGSTCDRLANTSPSLQTINEAKQTTNTLPTSGRLPVSDFMVSREPLPEAAVGSRSQRELIELNEMVKSNEINLNEAQMLFKAWNNRYGRNNSASFKDRQKELSEIKGQYMDIRERHLQKKNERESSKGLFSVFKGFGGRTTKSTIKVNISDPVLQRQQKKKTRVFSKSCSSQHQLSVVVDRDSCASTASSSCSSRDSAWSQGSRESTSGAYDSEKDEVSGKEICSQRRKEFRSSDTNRLSLGSMYLQQAEQEGSENNRRIPPPVPPRKPTS